MAGCLLAACGTQAAPASDGRVIRLNMASDPPQLDSTRATDQSSGFILGHTQEGLTRYGAHGETEAGVAESWELRERGATFRLRENARWSDGKPVTAHDFVFAWRLVVDPANASEYAFLMYPVKNAEAVNKGKLPPSALGVRAVGDRVLEVEFERPCGYFLGLTAFPTYDPVREDFYRARPGRYAASPEDLLSNGPFVLTKWVHEASMTLEKNPRYWDAGRIRLDRIEVPYFTNDANARFNLFMNGKIDLMGLGPDEIKRAQAERLRMKSYSDGSVWYLEFNHRQGRPTGNVHLRRAMQLAFDAREFVSGVVAVPGTRPGVALIPYWMPGLEKPYRQEYPYTPPRPNLEEAKRELALAKAELGGVIPPLLYLTDDGPVAGRQGEYFQYLFGSRLGLDVRIDKQLFKQRLAKMTSGDFDIVAAGWGPDFADPMTFADLFTSWNENNRGRYRNDRVDALIRKAQGSSDRKERLDAMAEAERILLDEVAILPTYERVSVYAHSRRVDGIIRHQIGPDPDLRYATVVDPEPAGR